MDVINFDIENVQIFEDKNDSQFVTARVDAFSTGKSKNNTVCDLEALQKTASTLYEKPIIFEYDKILDDFGTHHDGVTIPAGFVVPGSGEFKEQPDGRVTFSVFAKIWRRYSGKFIEIFKQYDTKNKNVSVEVELFDSEKMPDGLLKMKDWAYAAICVLGDFVSPASPGANIELTSFAKQEKESYDKAYYLEFGRYDSINFKIPKSVKDNVKEGLELYQKHNRGGTSFGLSTARYLVNENIISPQKAKRIAKYLSRHNNGNFEDKTSNDWISWCLVGGNAGKTWFEKINSQIKEADDKHVKYFDMLTFPYDKLKDVNPALKGIDPPITLAQANQIARVADSIGSDEKKSGWAIAISQFKKSHIVKDGKWVKRENMSEDKLTKEFEKEEKPVEDEKDVKQEPKSEEPEEEQKEEEKQEEEKKEEEFSSDAYLDVVAMLAMLEDETENYRALAEEEFAKPEEDRNFAKVCGAMYGKMCKMKAYMQKKDEESEKAKKDEEAYMTELMSLREYKAKIEKQQYDYAVQSFLDEVRKDIPKDELDKFVEDSKEYNLETLDNWKNIVKATAYTFARAKSENEDIPKYGILNNKKENKKNSLWE